MGVKLDLSKMKYLNSDDKSTTLQHPAGHTITLHHNVLSPNNQTALKALSKIPQQDETQEQKSEYGKVIKKFDDGGVVSNEGRAPVPSNQPTSSTTAPRPEERAAEHEKSSANSAGSGASSLETAVNRLRNAWADGGKVCEHCGGPVRKMADGGQPDIDPSLLTPQQPPQGMPEFQPLDPEKPVIAPQLDQAKSWLMSPAGSQIDTQVSPADVAATKANADVDALKEKENQAQVVASAADQNAAAQAPSMQSPEGLAQRGLSQEIQGAQELGKAQGALGEAQAGALQQDAARKQDIANHYQQSFQELNGERQAHIADIQQGYIDPDQYWKGDANGNGSHSKIAAGIGMILAGFNPTNRPNAAIEFLNHQLDRNIDAQKANLGAKNNLLTANLHQFQNLKDATDMTRVMQADVIKSQLEQAAAKAQTPIAQAQAKSAIGQIDAKYQPIFMQLQIRQMMKGLGNGGTQAPGSVGAMLSGLDMMSPEQAKSYRERYYQPYDIPGGKSIADRPITPADRTSLASYDKFDAAAKNLNQLIERSKGKGALNPIERNAAAQQAMVLQSLFREGTLGTVYKAGEQPLLDKAIDGQPLGLVHYFTEQPKLEGLMKSNEMMKNTTLDNYGLRPPQSKQTSNPMEGKTISNKKTGQRLVMKNGAWVPVGR